MRFETVLSYYSLKTLEDKNMKKLSIVGGILFALGMLVATGIDVNPVQAIYALLLLGGGAVCFAYADSAESEHKNETSINLKKWEDAA